MTDATTYAPLAMSATTTITRKSMLDSIKAMEWLNYEVDPEWGRFCSFGPEDIGSVWEQIGAIRKKPRYSMALVSEELFQKINKRIENNLLYGEPYVYGISVQPSRMLSGMNGYLVKDV